MSRRRSKDAAPGGRSLVAANETLALAWLRAFESSTMFSTLGAPVRQSGHGFIEAPTTPGRSIPNTDPPPVAAP